MRIIYLPLLLCLLSASLCFSQNKVEHYYNYYWRECPVDDARFYSLEKKTDSGWFKTDFFINLKKLQMMGLYEDKESTMPNGTFYWFYPDGTLKSSGQYVHSKKTGVWLNYFPDKSIKDSESYTDGHLSRVSLGWYSNGSAKDSFNLDANGNGVYISWFDNGNPSSAGRYVNFNKHHGKWQYFHKNGKLSSLEMYDHDKLIDKNYFDEDGNPMSDTTNNDRPAEFAGGEKGWRKYISENIFFPSGYEFKIGSEAFVLVTGSVNEEGKIIDIEVNAPIVPAIDKIVVAALKNSPAWHPARSHNREVYGTASQLVFASQSYYQ
jgi:antitoxin component YwqK of YwqJK toxin-antitoxin module